jgi:rhamnulokinase
VDGRRFLAFDLGAESGRAVVGVLQEGRLSLEEIYRFANEPVEVSGTLYWDVLALYNHVLKGMRAYVARFGDTVESVGIDTWGVDFAFLDRHGKLLQNPVHYRDRRTQGMPEEICRRLAPEDLFQRTGMALSPINTSVQLFSLRVKQSPLLESAATLMMMPDLFAYFLTGQKKCERTEAITTQLYEPRERQWSKEILRALDVPLSLMPELVDPGTVLGELHDSVRASVGLKLGVVIAPCTHDTGSAVAAVPGKQGDWAFLSSGTWSAIGALTEQVITSPEAFSAGVFNELTLGSFFVCRNIMGLWLLQRVRAAWQGDGRNYSYQDLVKLAEQIPAGGPLVDPTDMRFLAPLDMPQAIREYCAATQQRQPEGVGEITRCILESLALSYRHRLDQIASLMRCKFRILHIVGGGSRNTLLCQLTANATGIPVLAGPAEATVAGNILVQALAVGFFSTPEEIREVVRASSNLAAYEPQALSRWQDYYGKYLQLVKAG